MTQLIAQLKQIAVGEGLFPSQMQIAVRVMIAFVIGLLVTCIFI